MTRALSENERLAPVDAGPLLQAVAIPWSKPRMTRQVAQERPILTTLLADRMASTAERLGQSSGLAPNAMVVA